MSSVVLSHSLAHAKKFQIALFGNHFQRVQFLFQSVQPMRDVIRVSLQFSIVLSVLLHCFLQTSNVLYKLAMNVIEVPLVLVHLSG